MKEKILEAQKHLKQRRLDGWLLYDFHRNNPLAHAFLQTPAAQMVTRRLFYWIPVRGDPIQIVHAIEPYSLAACPGEKRLYSSWQTLQQTLQKTLEGTQRIAMEYSPQNAIPYVSKVDGGTIDLIRSFGIDVVSSADFLLYFTSLLSEAQAQEHLAAAEMLGQIANETWQWIAKKLEEGTSLNEYAVQQKILSDFQEKKLISESPPIVAVNAASADPHYVPSQEASHPICKGDFILIDLWGKKEVEGAVYADITRVAVAASQPTQRQDAIFQIVRQAQRIAVSLIQSRFAEKSRVEGWEVDDAARRYIEKKGFGSQFIHRTGHSIEVELHGSGTHMDNLEMHDTRPILPRSCFSIEPGIYLKGEFGVRLEHDVYIDADGCIHVTGGVQDKIACLG